jgi:hypothetical protein
MLKPFILTRIGIQRTKISQVFVITLDPLVIIIGNKDIDRRSRPDIAGFIEVFIPDSVAPEICQEIPELIEDLYPVIAPVSYEQPPVLTEIYARWSVEETGGTPGPAESSQFFNHNRQWDNQPDNGEQQHQVDHVLSFLQQCNRIRTVFQG